jgi:hypothetical protein
MTVVEVFGSGTCATIGQKFRLAGFDDIIPQIGIVISASPIAQAVTAAFEHCHGFQHTAARVRACGGGHFPRVIYVANDNQVGGTIAKQINASCDRAVI